MPAAPAESGSLMARHWLTPCLSQGGLGTKGKGGERATPIKSVTLPIAGTPPKCRQQGLGGAVLLE